MATARLIGTLGGGVEVHPVDMPGLIGGSTSSRRTHVAWSGEPDPGKRLAVVARITATKAGTYANRSRLYINSDSDGYELLDQGETRTVTAIIDGPAQVIISTGSNSVSTDVIGEIASASL